MPGTRIIIYGQCSSAVSGPLAWNDLPRTLRASSVTFRQFQRRLYRRYYFARVTGRGLDALCTNVQRLISFLTFTVKTRRETIEIVAVFNRSMCSGCIDAGRDRLQDIPQEDLRHDSGTSVNRFADSELLQHGRPVTVWCFRDFFDSCFIAFQGMHINKWWCMLAVYKYAAYLTVATSVPFSYHVRRSVTAVIPCTPWWTRDQK